MERDVLTPEFMNEIKDSVIMVSIENAPKTYEEGMKYLIDVPCKHSLSNRSMARSLSQTLPTDPTGFHLSPSAKGAKPTVGNYFFNNERPYMYVSFVSNLLRTRS